MLCGKLKNIRNQPARKKTFYYYKGFLFTTIISLLRTIQLLEIAVLGFNRKTNRRVSTRKKNSIFSSIGTYIGPLQNIRFLFLIQLPIYSHERGEGRFENNI